MQFEVNNIIAGVCWVLLEFQIAFPFTGKIQQVI
jgi:hypothetical protein